MSKLTPEKLKILKKQSKLTLSELSDITQIPLGTLNKMASGELKIDEKKEKILLDALEKSRRPDFGFVRVAAANCTVKVANCAENAEAIAKTAEALNKKGVDLALFPELCLTGYTCGDLFLSQTLLAAAEKALRSLVKYTEKLSLVLVVGMPVTFRGKLYNAAVVIHAGKILGVAPKNNLPNYGEFYEKRYFSVPEAGVTDEIVLCGETVPFGEMVFVNSENENFRFACEICEDLWSANPPSEKLSRCGANVILNLSASNETAGKAAVRKSLVSAQSLRCCCAYLYSDAGDGESTTDVVFGGHNLVAECGKILSEAAPFSEKIAIADVDLQAIASQRLKKQFGGEQTFQVEFCKSTAAPEKLLRAVSSLPFVPQDEQTLETILKIQTKGLCTRAKSARIDKFIVGVSGGLDSALALLVCMRAVNVLGKKPSDVVAISMPAPSTSERTFKNSVALPRALGATCLTIDISASLSQHLSDLHHDGAQDVAYENSQARERTQILMDYANMVNGLVVGTGDLSEAALGWCTYNGDHMSMYAVNCFVPKTLVRRLAEFEAARLGKEVGKILRDVLDTPVSPELKTEGGKMQSTEDAVGPYELTDFYLYFTLEYGFSPQKILFLARQAFADKYDDEALTLQMKRFVTRFFSQQFKRSCVPDGVKTGDVSLSPRGDWRMPSDASAMEWLKDFE